MSRNSGIILMTSRESSTSSASLALMQSQVWCCDLIEPRPVPLELDELAEVVAEPLGPERSNPAQNAGSLTSTQPASAIRL